MNKRPEGETRATASEFVRTIIWRRSLKAATVAQASGVAPASLSRFLARKRTLTATALDKVAVALGLELVETKGGLR